MNKIQMRQSLLLLLTATIWGVAFVAQSVGMEYVGPLTFSCVRSLLGGIVLIPCIWFLGRHERASHPGREISQYEAGKSQGERAVQKEKGKRDKGADRELLAGGMICGLLLCLASNFQQFGIAHTSVGKAGFITALYIVIVPILGLLFHKKCRPLIWLGVCLAVAGLYFLCMAGGDAQAAAGQIFPGIPIGKGDFLVFICALLFSGHILAIDYFTERVDGVKMSCIQFWVCGIVSGIGMFLAEEPHFPAILMAWKELLYAGVMSCGVAYTLQIVGQKGMDPTVASLILSLESVISALAGLFILGQKLSGAEILGCILMFAAIVLAQLAGAEKKAVPSPTTK
jgi:drug/metabolite transporter (DMT)-like permease